MGEQVGEAALGVVDPVAVGGDQAGGVGAGGGRGHLLAQHRAQCELGLVDRAGHAPAGCLVHQGCEDRVGAQPVVDGDRVGVQVEQAPAAGESDGQVAQVAEGEAAGDVVGVRGERDDAVAVGQAQGAAVGAVPPFLDAGHGGRGEVAEEVVGGERGAEGEAEGEGLGWRG